ncbi:uncharacterized protein [Miscanthus floridulus]|uniref:uncharacterized protein n=1 Tax=Miscanthus floridulus TaxID=154761 RepID=UPI00345AA500
MAVNNHDLDTSELLGLGSFTYAGLRRKPWAAGQLWWLGEMVGTLGAVSNYWIGREGLIGNAPAGQPARPCATPPPPAPSAAAARRARATATLLAGPAPLRPHSPRRAPPQRGTPPAPAGPTGAPPQPETAAPSLSLRVGARPAGAPPPRPLRPAPAASPDLASRPPRCLRLPHASSPLQISLAPLAWRISGGATGAAGQQRERPSSRLLGCRGPRHGFPTTGGPDASGRPDGGLGHGRPVGDHHGPSTSRPPPRMSRRRARVWGQCPPSATTSAVLGVPSDIVAFDVGISMPAAHPGNALRLVLNTLCSSSSAGGLLQLARSAIHFGDGGWARPRGGGARDATRSRARCPTPGRAAFPSPDLSAARRELQMVSSSYNVHILDILELNKDGITVAESRI